MQPHEIRCFRCRRISKKADTVCFRGQYFGPTCLELTKKRYALRGKGPGAKLIIPNNGGEPVFISNLTSIYCPDEKDDCIQCAHFEDPECPLERGCKEFEKVIYRI